MKIWKLLKEGVAPFNRRGLTPFLFLMIFMISASSLFAGTAVPGISVMKEDIAVVEQFRLQLMGMMAYMEDRVATSDEVVSRQQKLALWNSWVGWLDIYAGLDRYGEHYDVTFKSLEEESYKYEAFKISYYVFLIEYRYAMSLISLVEVHPNVVDILNDAVPELGIPPGTYTSFKDRFLSVVRAAEFVQLGIVYYAYSEDGPSLPWVDEYEQYLLTYSQTDGLVYTLDHALNTVEDSALTAWYPIKKELLTYSSDIKVWRMQETLISYDQLRDVQSHIQPGDILIQKREWQLSNVGIPGFWTHAAIYVGTPEERIRYFSKEENDLIFSKMQSHRPDGAVIETIKDGVVLSSFFKSAKADSLLVLRPALTVKQKASVIAQAFDFLGRPYDYDFNFNTDSSFVCSELICTLFEPVLFPPNQTFPRSDVAGNILTSPNDIVAYFSRHLSDEHPPFEFVLFLDGIESEERAEASDLHSALESWKRPKWYVLDTF